MYIYVIALVALFFNIFTNNTYATNGTSDTATIDVGASCSITATITTEHSATMVNGTYSGTNYPNGIGSTTLQTFCNDRNGYAIYAVGYTNNEEGNTVLKGNAGLDPSNDIVTGIATSGTSGNDVSNWAMKVSAVSGIYAPTITNGFGSFSAVPSTYTEVAQYNHPTDSASGTNIGSTITTTYAAYISNSQPAGTYTGQVKYVLVHPDFDVSTARTMQNIAEWENELLPGVQATAVDNRDGTEYTVAKLKDGNIWMLDNLALGSDTAITLTNADTNMAAASWILPASDTTGFDSSTGYAAAVINTESKNDTQPLAIGQSGTGKIGVYYNYCAATAGTYCESKSQTGTSNATSDICPKGWRLPTGGASGEFQALRDLYASNGEYALALRTPLSGAFYDGSAHGQDGFGYFWSSTFYDAAGMYHLLVSTTNIYPQYSLNRFRGFSVRCVREVLPTMQSATTSSLAALMPNDGDAAILRDSRDDNIYSVSNIGGKYWMTKNLDLAGGTTLTPEDSNVTSNYTLPASSTSGFSDSATAYVYNSGSTTCGNDSPCYSYYSYVAATAGTNPSSGNATSDICPKGWRLPSQAEYNTLISTYTTGATLTASPWLGVYAGHYVNSRILAGGEFGYYWSSTAYDSAYVYYLIFHSLLDAGVVIYDVDKRDGLSVRCVLQ